MLVGAELRPALVLSITAANIFVDVEHHGQHHHTRDERAHGPWNLDDECFSLLKSVTISVLSCIRALSLPVSPHRPLTSDTYEN
jgi:hypothetical protein